MVTVRASLAPADRFVTRHIGPRPDETRGMLATLAYDWLEALLNFQTMVADLTALPIANASLLDEATAAAEAMNLTEAVAKVPPGTTPMFMIAEGCHPQTIAVVRTRAEARGVQTVIADPAGFEFRPGVIGALLQYPTTEGKIEDYRAFCDKAHAAGALVTVATDLLALTVLL